MRKKRNLISMLMMSFAISVILFGCGTEGSNFQGDNEFRVEVIDLESAPQEVKNQYELDMEKETRTIIDIDEDRYVLATMGMQGSAGYAIVYKNVRVTENDIELTIEYITPKKGEAVAEVLTYPELVLKMPMTDKEIHFLIVGTEENREDDIPEENNVFDSIQVNEKIASMTVLEAEMTDFTARVAFKGEATISGTYRYNPNDEFVDSVQFIVDEESVMLLPKWVKDERYVWMTFTNDDMAREAFNIEDGIESDGVATIIIDDYIINYAPTEIWNTATLIKVVEK